MLYHDITSPKGLFHLNVVGYKVYTPQINTSFGSTFHLNVVGYKVQNVARAGTPTLAFHLNVVGYKEGSAIYFAVDFDVVSSERSGI